MDKEFLKELFIIEEFKLVKEIVKGMEIDFNMDILVDEVGYIIMYIRGVK